MTGLILLDKPQGMTSFGAVARVRRIFGEKRAGHTGTLDPMATGVLPILLGRSTRLCGMILEADKRYTAEILLGTETDTYDVTGEILSQTEPSLELDDALSVLAGFRGKIRQTPPIFSALKKNGERLYDIARRGETVEIEAREIEIKELNVISLCDKVLTVDVLCSKGTYIRSLAHDIGAALGCGATLKSLRRTQTGGFDIADCVSLEQLEKEPLKCLQQADLCINYLPKVTVTDNQRIRYLNGGELFVSRVDCDGDISDGEMCRVYDREGAFLGISERSGDLIKVKCLIFEGDLQ